MAEELMLMQGTLSVEVQCEVVRTSDFQFDGWVQVRVFCHHIV